VQFSTYQGVANEPLRREIEAALMEEQICGSDSIHIICLCGGCKDAVEIIGNAVQRPGHLVI
jgi:CRISPR/Cas system-associated endoribonuclease Cas2